MKELNNLKKENQLKIFLKQRTYNKLVKQYMNSNDSVVKENLYRLIQKKEREILELIYT